MRTEAGCRAHHCGLVSRWRLLDSVAVAGYGAFIAVDDLVNQLCHRETEDGIHVIPKTPVVERLLRFAASASQPLTKVIEKRVEVIVANDEHATVRLRFVVCNQVLVDLQPHGGFAGTLGAEDDRGRGFRGVTVDLVPSW